jgi:hypothetical protein
MPRETDDQPARARWAAEEGVARALGGPGDDDLERELSALLDSAERERLREGCRRVRAVNGAVEAAAEVDRLARGKRPRKPVRDRGALKRWLRLSSHRVGPTLPLALALTARDLIRHPERRRPKALVYALGPTEDDYATELERAVDSFELPRDRVLVITDSLELGLIRDLGVALQRIPAAAELGLSFDDPAYRRLLDERFELAVSPWRGSWPLKRIGKGNQILREEAAGDEEAASETAAKGDGSA